MTNVGRTRKLSVGELNGKWSALFKISMVVLPVALSAGVAAQGWILNRLSGIDNNMKIMSERMAVVETSRFSSQDRMEIWGAIGQLKEQLARVPAEIPPTWMVEKLNRVDQRLNDLAIQHAALEASRKR